MAELLLSRAESSLRRHIRPDGVTDGVPRHVPIDVGIFQHTTEEAVARAGRIGITATGQPKFVPRVRLTLGKPAVEDVGRLFTKRDRPVLAVLRRLIFWNSQNSIVDVHPVRCRSSNHDRAESSVEGSVDHRGILLRPFLFPVVLANLIKWLRETDSEKFLDAPTFFGCDGFVARNLVTKFKNALPELLAFITGGMSLGLLSFADVRICSESVRAGGSNRHVHRIQTPRLTVIATANGHMSDPIRQQLAEDLHALSFGDAVACDYHHRPKTIDSGEVLVEAIRLVDHPQLQRDEWPSGWVLDAARCSECAVESIVEPTKGFEEAVVELPITTTNNVVSVATPTSDAVSVLAYSSATEGTHPMVLSQRLMDAAPSGDMGFPRWNRVQALLEGSPADPSREHIKGLIERSHEIPSTFE